MMRPDIFASSTFLGVPVRVHKRNPYHDAEGQFTSKDKAVNPGAGGSKSEAAKKAWAKIYQKKALQKLESPEFAEMYSKALDGDMKMDAKLSVLSGNLQNQYVSNGGDLETFSMKLASVMDKVASTKLGPQALKLVQEANAAADDYAKSVTSMPAGESLVKPKPMMKPPANMTPGQKAAWTKQQKKLQAQGGMSAATVAKPKATSTPSPELDPNKLPTKWDDPDNVSHAKEQNHKLGVAYYLHRQVYGKDHPKVAELYSEWQKSKDWLTANSTGFNTSQTSQEAKTAAEALHAKVNAVKLQSKTALQTGLDAYHQHSSTPGVGKDALKNWEAGLVGLKKSFLDQGYSEDDYDEMVNDAKAKAVKYHAAKKNELGDKINAAAYAKAMAEKGSLAEHSADALLTMLKQDATKYGLAGADVAAAVNAGIKKAKAHAEKEKQLAAMFGDKSKIIDYYKNKFEPLDAEHLQSHVTPKNNAENEYKKHHEAKWALMTNDEKEALQNFWGSGYSAQNKAVGKGHETKNAKLTASALEKVTLGADMNLRRNMPQKWFWKALGFGEEKFADGNKFTQSELDSVIGKVYKEAATVSTTKSLNSNINLSQTAAVSGTVSLMIRAHKNVKALDATIAASTSIGENEVTLGPNSHFLIRKITPKKGLQGKSMGFDVEVDLLFNGKDA